MKNAISYYYNLNPVDIHQINGMYKFNNNSNFYSLIPINIDISDVNDIYNISVELNRRGIYTHQIILNGLNEIVTYINDNRYVLLKTYGEMKEKILENDLIYYTNVTINISMIKSLRRDDWYNLWINKMDYFEYKINQIGKKYPNLRESFSYFLGMVETGISLLINEKIENKNLSICHKRIKKNYTLFDLYNPFNFIIDTKVRDMAEYFKEIFMSKNPYDLIINYLDNNNLTDSELKLFFIRMLYPSFYFDIYEEVILGNIDEEEIKKTITMIDSYEELLRKVYIHIRQKVSLYEIEWLN